MTLNYGLRWERWHGWIPPETSPAGTFVAARSYQKIEGPDWNNWTPRFGFSYDITGKGKTVIKGSVNRYVQGEGMALLANSLNPLAYSTASVPWTCPASEGTAACILAGPTPAQLNLTNFKGFTTGGANTHLDPNIQRPFSWEESFGLQQELPSGILVSVRDGIGPRSSRSGRRTSRFRQRRTRR